MLQQGASSLMQTPQTLILFWKKIIPKEFSTGDPTLELLVPLADVD